ncbi:MAG: hypothetical protein Q8Q39_00975 [bacterium]|nr:hypothetical protein [bacterium]
MKRILTLVLVGGILIGLLLVSLQSLPLLAEALGASNCPNPSEPCLTTGSYHWTYLTTVAVFLFFIGIIGFSWSIFKSLANTPDKKYRMILIGMGVFSVIVLYTIRFTIFLE